MLYYLPLGHFILTFSKVGAARTGDICEETEADGRCEKIVAIKALREVHCTCSKHGIIHGIILFTLHMREKIWCVDVNILQREVQKGS